MKKLLLLVLILVLPQAYSSWTTYQGDLRNSGVSYDIGYFPTNLVNFTVNFGTELQPLVDDLNLDGKNDIIIFNNETLYILDAQLNIQSQIKVGNVSGQPAIFNTDSDSFKEIVVNSYQKPDSYFFAYQYDTSLSQEFNLSLNRDAYRSGIKCVDGLRLCVFKDSFNYVHLVDIESRAGHHDLAREFALLIPLGRDRISYLLWCSHNYYYLIC